MQTLFQKMRAHRVRWVDQPIQPQADDSWRLKAMVVDGQMYVEAIGFCNGCSFREHGCMTARAAAVQAFGRSCIEEQSLIYIKAE